MLVGAIEVMAHLQFSLDLTPSQCAARTTGALLAISQATQTAISTNADLKLKYISTEAIFCKTQRRRRLGARRWLSEQTIVYQYLVTITGAEIMAGESKYRSAPAVQAALNGLSDGGDGEEEFSVDLKHSLQETTDIVDVTVEQLRNSIEQTTTVLQDVKRSTDEDPDDDGSSSDEWGFHRRWIVAVTLSVAGVGLIIALGFAAIYATSATHREEDQDHRPSHEIKSITIKADGKAHGRGKGRGTALADIELMQSHEKCGQQEGQVAAAGKGFELDNLDTHEL